MAWGAVMRPMLFITAYQNLRHSDYESFSSLVVSPSP